ncbi:MAG: c-type cytochrome [Rhodomicrobium sp.]
MKVGSLRAGGLIALLSVLCTAGAQAGELQDKIEYCKNCHGSSGQGLQGFYTAPRIASQQQEYLENQFKAIAQHARDDPPAVQFMWPTMASVKPGLRPSVARYYSRLNPGPAADGPKSLVGAGKKIFTEGVPEKNVPACSACHGEDAKGNGSIPRLAGQLYSYTVSQLKGWSKGYRHKSSIAAGEENTMLPIATAMSEKQIEAVAAYLSYQR